MITNIHPTPSEPNSEPMTETQHPASTSHRVHPLHVTLLTVILSLLAALGAGIGIATFVGTRLALRALSADLMDQVTQQTIERINGFLGSAEPALKLTRATALADPEERIFSPAPFDNGRGEEWRARARLCLRVLEAYPDLVMVYYGDRNGYFTGARRTPGLPDTVEHRWRDHGKTLCAVFDVDTTGLSPQWKVRGLLRNSSLDNFVPKSRPWYVKAASEKRFIWTEPYLFRTIHGTEPGITAALPLLDHDRQVAGVFGADFTAVRLHDFVQSFQAARRQVFILSRNTDEGDRVLAEPESRQTLATSTDTAGKLLGVERSPNDLLRVIGSQLRRIPGKAVSEHSEGRVKVGGKAYLWDSNAFRLGRDLNWLIVTSVLESDVLGVEKRNLTSTLLLCFLFLILAAAVGVYLSLEVSLPLRAFVREMRQVGNFVLSDHPSPTSTILEVNNMGRELDKMKASLRSFEKYVPAEVVRSLLLQGLVAEPGAESARVTLFFADIIGFTHISEQVSPDILVRSLAVYLDQVEKVVSNQNGVIDKCYGDCVIAIWDPPIRPEPDPEKQACAAALQCVVQLQEVEKAVKPEGLIAFHAGIGIHSGEAVVGNIGSPQRLGYTAIGDAVNLASRLESLNRIYGTRILISESTRLAAGDSFEARLVDWVVVKGREGSIPIYELLSRAGQLDPALREVCDRYGQGLSLYRARRFPEAKACFRQCLETRPDDGPSHVMLARCEQYIVSPPARDWDGVHVMETK